MILQFFFISLKVKMLINVIILFYLHINVKILINAINKRKTKMLVLIR